MSKLGYNIALAAGVASLVAGAALAAGAAAALITAGATIIGLTLFSSYFGGVH